MLNLLSCNRGMKGRYTHLSNPQSSFVASEFQDISFSFPIGLPALLDILDEFFFGLVEGVFPQVSRVAHQGIVVEDVQHGFHKECIAIMGSF